jgi:hypothetical protein
LYTAGPAIFVHAKNRTFNNSLIKETKVKDKAVLQKIRTAFHKNPVCLYEALYNEGSIFLSYEVMDVPLVQVFSTPFGKLKSYEIAAFCAEVLAGIEYIHGSLSAETVPLKTNGEIKIVDCSPAPPFPHARWWQQTLVLPCYKPQKDTQNRMILE